MTTVDIQYCVPCGHLNRAQQLQEAILSEFGQDVESVTLHTGDSGVFTVDVDGDRIFDVDEDEFDQDAIVEEVKQQL